MPDPIKKKSKLGILSPYQEKLCNSPEGCSDFVSKQLLLDQGYNQANAEEFNKYLTIFKNSTGVKDDAWRTSNHISKQGGKSIYKNIEGIPKVDNTKEGFKKGDIIGMYNNTSYGSSYQNTADKNQLYGKGAKNVNTHLGYISEVDDEGNVYVEHYLPGLSGEGVYRRDILKYDDKSKKYNIYKPQTNGKGLYKGEYDVNSIDRPNYDNFKSNKESLKILEQEYDNYKFNTSSLNNIKNPYIQKSKEEFLKNAKILGSLTGLKPNQLEKLFYITLGQGEQETNSGGYNSKSTLDNINNKLSENKFYTNLVAPIAKSIITGVDNVRSTTAEIGNKITGYDSLKPGWKRELILKQHVKEGKLTEKALNDKQYINDYINQNPEIFGKYNERNSDYSPSSKGWLKSKYVSNLAQNLNIGDYDIQNKPEKAFLNSLLINSENYYRVKNLNPDLKEEDVNYLTTSMYNQPGLIKNKEYTDNYLKNRDIDYSNKVYNYSKDLYNYNIEPKKQEVNTNMSYKWADINPSTFRNGGRIKKKKLTSTWEPFDTSNPGNIVDVGGINPLKNGGTIPQDNTYVSPQNLQNGTSINNSKQLWFNQYPRQMGRMETFKQVVDPALQFGFSSASLPGLPATNIYQKEFTNKVNNTVPRNYSNTPNKWLHTEDNFGTMLPGKVNKPTIDQATNLKNSNVSMKYNLSNKTAPKNLVYRVNHNVDVNDAAYIDYGQPMNKVPVDKYFKQEFPDKFKGDVEWDFSKNKNGGIINNNMNILNTMVRQYPNRNGTYSYKKGGRVKCYDFGGAIGDAGLILADTALGSLGLNNVIREKNFNTPGGKDAERNYENYGHPIMETISNMVPVYGQLAQAERSVAGQFNPQVDGSKRQVNYGALATGAIQGASMAYGASQSRSSKPSTSNASDLVNNTSNNIAYTTPNGTTYNDPYRSQFMALGGPINPNGVNQMSQLSPRNYNKILIDVEKNELELDKNGNLVRIFLKQFLHNKFGADPNINYVNATIGNTIIPKNQADEVMNMSLKDRKKRMDVLALNQNIRESKQMRNGIPRAELGIKIPREHPYYSFDGEGTIVGPSMENGRFSTQGYNPYIPANNSVQNPGQFFGGQSNVGNMGYDNLFSTKNNRTKNNSDTLTNINKYASLAPAAYNLAMGLFDKPEKLNAGNYTNNQPVVAGKVNRRSLLDESNKMAAVGKYGLKRNGNASVGTYTDMISDIQNNYSNALANADNMDLQYRSQADQFNSQTRDRNGQMRFQVDDWNSRSKAGQRRYLDNAFTDIGQYSSQEAQNQQLMDIYNRIYPKARRGGRV